MRRVRSLLAVTHAPPTKLSSARTVTAMTAPPLVAAQSTRARDSPYDRRVDGLLARRQVSLDIALALLSRVRDEAAAGGLSLAAAVVDGGGHVVASQRMDGTAVGAMKLALGKAYTSILWETRTAAFMDSTQPGGDDWAWNTTDSRIVV